ncbi:MAG: hypothetical protein VW270_05660 [Candidatus Poseidoniales archaeon]
MITQHGTIDIYTTEQSLAHIKDNVKQAVVYVENEYGGATSIAIESIGAKPVGHIATHLISNMVFNQTAEYDSFGWKISTYDDKLIININEYPNTPIYPLEEARGTWIYAYPPIRDLVTWLQSNGIEDITYLASTTIHELVEGDPFRQREQHEIQVVDFVSDDFSEIEEGNHLFMNPPVWIVLEIAKRLSFNTAKGVFVGFDKDEKVNVGGAEAIANYLQDNLDITYTNDSMEKAIEKLKEQIKAGEDMRAEIEALMNTKPANNTMWG